MSFRALEARLHLFARGTFNYIFFWLEELMPLVNHLKDGLDN